MEEEPTNRTYRMTLPDINEQLLYVGRQKLQESLKGGNKQRDLLMGVFTGSNLSVTGIFLLG